MSASEPGVAPMQTVAEAIASQKAILEAQGVPWAVPLAGNPGTVDYISLLPIGEAAVPPNCMFVEITTGVLSFKAANGAVHALY